MAAHAITRALLPRIQSHRALARVGIAIVAIAMAAGVSLQGASAGPTRAPGRPPTLLSENVGIGVPTSDPVTVSFDWPMDRASVESLMAIRPRLAVRTAWSSDGRTLRLTPQERWRTDTRYQVSIAATAQLSNGKALGAPRQVSFTTQTAPLIDDFQLRYLEQSDEVRMRAMAQQDTTSLTPAADTAEGASSQTSITIGFSAAMDRQDVQRRFNISPAVPGVLRWAGNAMIFTPAERLAPDARYAVSVVGARDSQGNRLGGDTAFSFTTRSGAQVVRVSPLNAAKNVTDNQVLLWFSQPMDVEATRAALKVTDAASGAPIGGKSAWNGAGTQLRFTFSRALPPGKTIKVALAEAAIDLDRNAVTATWTFSTKAAPPPPVAAARQAGPAPTGPAPAPAPPGPAAPADLAQYALWQVNQSRAQFGRAPLVLDSRISAVASAHAWDMLNYNYFSHTGRDGSRVADRMRRAGISFGWSGENICYHSGIGVKPTLNWCHSVFMAEPPNQPNHRGNILGGNYRRIGIGIAQSGGKVKIVWDFAG